MKHLCNEVNEQTRKETAAAQVTSIRNFSYGVCENTAKEIVKLIGGVDK